MPTELHVIFGTGPVGCWTARALRSQGRAVRAVNRSGARPSLPISVTCPESSLTTGLILMISLTLKNG
jgi:hypothetical protein